MITLVQLTQLNIQTMSKNNHIILGAACAALGLSFAAYYAFNVLSKQKPKQIDLEMTKKIIQQIKHQMLITCINFTNQMQKRSGHVNMVDPQTSEFLKTEMGKIYQQKQNMVLAKYNLDSYSFGNALKKHNNVQFIQKATKQIIDMMERSTAGRLPDLTVDPNVKSKFSKDQLAEIYYDLCQKIVELVHNRLKQQKRNDPYFDSRDDQSFRKAIRSLSIYDYKVDYLSNRGFLKVWGCPNQNFFKLIQSWKADDAEYKKKIMKIEKSYEKAIQQMSNDPQAVTQSKIAQVFIDSNPKKAYQNVAEKIQSIQVPRFIEPQQIVQHRQPQQNIMTSVKSDQADQSVFLQQATELKKTDSVQMQKPVFSSQPQQKQQQAQENSQNNQENKEVIEQSKLNSAHDQEKVVEFSKQNSADNQNVLRSFEGSSISQEKAEQLHQDSHKENEHKQAEKQQKRNE